MNLAEFRDRLDSGGPDLARWPDEHRAAAERLLAADPAAQTALDEARRQGRIRPGDIVLLNAFGAGFAWGAAVVKF